MKRRVVESKTRVGETPAIVQQVFSFPGQPLSADTRVLVERRLGHEFGDVPVHPDGRTAGSAVSVNPTAATVGADIVLGLRRYSPRTPEARRLIARELMRILQQRPVSLTGGSETSAPVVFSPALRATQPTAVPEGEPIGEKPARQTVTYVKDAAELQARLAMMTVAGRRNFVSTFFVEVQWRWDHADALGVLDWLKNVSRAEQKMTTNPVRPIADLPQNAPQVYGHKLKVDVSGLSGTRLGRQLVLGDVTLDDAAATAVTATDAVMNLRRLNDLLTRALSAEMTARATGTPLADVLALYRVEGDLAVPPTLGSLEAGIPSDASDAAAVIDPFPDFNQLVWSVAPETVRDPNDPSRALDDDKIKEIALSHWFVRIGGLNEVGLLAYPKQIDFAAWSSRNWLAANDIDPTSMVRTAAADEASNRWTAQIDNLEVRRVTSATGLSGAVMVVPKHTETLITGILSEAVMRHRAGGKLLNLLGALPAGSARRDLTPGLAYLLCNAGEENFKLMLASATVAASRTRAARYGELQSVIAAKFPVGIASFVLSRVGELSDQLQPSLPRGVRDRITAEILAFSTSLWKLMGGWLLNDARRLELLGEFMETASPTLWPSWTESRGNMSRYNVLRAYYQLL